jgi:ribonuclease III
VTCSPEKNAALLEGRLAFKFARIELAQAALVHKSYANEQKGDRVADNERLEFLGDAVIDLAVSHRLMDRFPAATEGELSKLRAVLVDEEALARAARRISLGDLLCLGRGEEMTGGRNKSSLLADALEAAVGAVYLDAGIGKALEVVDRLLEESFVEVARNGADRDYKTRLQEVIQAELGVCPKYRVVQERGPDHQKEFVVELMLNEVVLGQGTGRSKKEAEQTAARMALARVSSEGLRTVVPDASVANASKPESP